eukprot:TRINITY_DN44080_c0_g1_i1.p1 TRINITY_DN44080_c0_g1~~TRINITY_DN44080_c0_g1_i1.p1  ORF type:complete len:285 (-),score=16.56 TRINITY_DN44080_c0_g1_i1:165-1019(-)
MSRHTKRRTRRNITRFQCLAVFLLAMICILFILRLRPSLILPVARGTLLNDDDVLLKASAGTGRAQPRDTRERSLAKSGGNHYVPNAEVPPADSREMTERSDIRTSASLLSIGCPASSDVRGNLGAASVVTDPSTKDWLRDRWQAASNMHGKPIPGPHWVAIDLMRPVLAERFVLDWDTAFASEYVVVGATIARGPWHSLASGRDAQPVLPTKRHHVVHALSAKPQTADSRVVDLNRNASGRPVRFVRVDIARPATRWGASLWRFEVWGQEATSGTFRCQPLSS